MALTDGQGVDSAIEAFGAQVTFEACIRVTRPEGTCNTGYHGTGDYIGIPRVAWGGGMGDKTIRGGLCPGGRVRMERLLRLTRAGWVDPTKMTTHRFRFSEIETAFRLMRTKEEDIIKPLILFS